LFQKFAKTAKERLEQEPAEASASDEAAPSDASAASAVPATAANDDDEALSVLPLLLSTLGAAIRNFFSRLFGGSKN
jgi:hypothetical protein